jgi:hypothetical protein
MKFDWNHEKNKLLERTRNISFPEIMESGEILAVEVNPNYSNQRRLIIEYKDYIYSVPFVEDQKGIFLKTIIPSRKLTRIYGKGQKNER